MLSCQRVWHRASQLPLCLNAIVPYWHTESKQTLKTNASVCKHGSRLQPLLPSHCSWFGYPTDVIASMHSQRLFESYCVGAHAYPMTRLKSQCVSCRVGKSSMSQEDCTENIVATVVSALEHISKKWLNVQALHLKSVNSVALPIYQTLPAEQTIRIDSAKR